jgi:hypothetical protein
MRFSASTGEAMDDAPSKSNKRNRQFNLRSSGSRVQELDVGAGRTPSKAGMQAAD